MTAEQPALHTAVKVFGVVVDDGRVLVLQRAPRRSRAGEWDIPGGKLEPGEDPIDGLRREVLEETGLRLEVGRPLAVQSRVEGNEHGVVITFELRGQAGSVRVGDEHSTYRWVTPHELEALRCAYHVPAAVRALWPDGW